MQTVDKKQNWTAVAVLVCGASLFIMSIHAQSQRYPNRFPNPSGPNPLAQSSPTAGASSISVCVVDEEGFPFRELAIVKLSDGASQTVLWGSTALSSEAKFNNVVAGQYTVEVSADGFQTQQEGLTVTGVSQPYRIAITLRRGITAMRLDQILAPRARKETEKGIAALKQGNAAQAQKHFETAYKLAPGNADVNYLMGIALEKEKDPTTAEDYLGRAISFNPQHTGARIELGNLRLQRGAVDAAITVLEPAVLASPKSWPAHESLAMAYFRAQDFEKAREQTELAIRESKRAAVEPQLLLAEVLIKLDRRPEALRIVQSLVNQRPYLGSLPGVREVLEDIQANKGADREPQ